MSAKVTGCPKPPFPLILFNEVKCNNNPVSVGLSSIWWANSKASKIITCCSNHMNSKEEDQLRPPLWDDGYGTQTIKDDCLEAAKHMIQQYNHGPPRWYCPIESGPPPKNNAPVLLYLPGIDGLGIGLIMQHKSLGKMFEVRCMHIPNNDRTPYERLVRFVENEVRSEHSAFPDRPIYLVGESLGGCLALSVAAANPTIDLLLILVNPATSFNRSQLQPFFPLLEALPKEFDKILPFLFISVIGDPIKIANMTNTRTPLTSPTQKLKKLILELSALQSVSHIFTDSLPKETFIWKLRLLQVSAAHSNSRLHVITAQVLILASGRDSLLPSKQEAERLSGSLKHCKIRFFKNSSHALLMEDGVHLTSIIKGVRMFRRSKKHDCFSDFLPPSLVEGQHVFHKILGYLRLLTSPVTLSTLPDGTIVRSLDGVPTQGPVLLVGYHMLFGVDIGFLIEEFMKEKKVLVRGVAHPELFTENFESPLQEVSSFDYFRIFGAVPATPMSLFKLMSTKSHVLLYPGGTREALHRKGEEYKLFWPDEPEFIRMATKFGATIVPFGVVGEDDLLELVLDYDDLMRIPILNDEIKKRNKVAAKVRQGSNMKGEVSNQEFFTPGFYPKLPGRIYFLFGKPVETKGREQLLNDRLKAKELYMQIKSDVDQNIAYLLKKREEDAYRHLFDRLFYQIFSPPIRQIPSFDP